MILSVRIAEVLQYSELQAVLQLTNTMITLKLIVQTTENIGDILSFFKNIQNIMV